MGKKDESPLLPVKALSSDLELRARGSSPASLHRLLGPRLATYVREIEETLDQLKRLAREAPNTVVEAGIRVKIADTLLKLAKLGQQAHIAMGAPGWGGIRSQEHVPPWPQDVEIAQKIRELLELMREKGFRFGEMGTVEPI